MVDIINTRRAHNFKDLAGQMFGRLTVVDIFERRCYANSSPKIIWLCRCSCGVIVRCPSAHLANGNTRSCGCLKLDKLFERSTTHGKTRTPEYRSWNAMLNRCYNRNGQAYRNYGGRGIIVCDRWRDSFVNFLADMGMRPSKAYTIEREDNDGNYEPGNCSWQTKKVQANNRRTNRLITYQDKTLTVGQWADELGVSNSFIYARLNHGWSVEDALTKPRYYHPPKRSSIAS